MVRKEVVGRPVGRWWSAGQCGRRQEVVSRSTDLLTTGWPTGDLPPDHNQAIYPLTVGRPVGFQAVE